jgi:transposase-like protein
MLTKKQTELVLSKHLSQENGLNTVLEMVLNSMMLSERQEYLSENKGLTKGNGYRLGKVFGFGSQLELRIPRDRQSEFLPTILALFRDQESYLKEVSFQMYSKGLTVRDVSEVMETIYGSHYSKSTISNISQSFYEQMSSWRNRDLDKRYPVIYIDGLYVKVKRDNKYRPECFYIILGLKEDFTREIISIVNMPNESSIGWQHVLEELKDRGVKSTDLIVSDALSGIDKAISKVFPQAEHQKCIVHLQRNLKAYVHKDDRKELAEDVRNLLSPDNESHTLEKALNAKDLFKKKWTKKNKTFGKYLNKVPWQDYFTFLQYNVKIRRMIYTTNWIERFNKSARRTLKVRNAFPNEESVLALITSVAIDKGSKRYKYPIYNFNLEPKFNKN